jgi:hypothetical protein
VSDSLFSFGLSVVSVSLFAFSEPAALSVLRRILLSFFSSNADVGEIIMGLGTEDEEVGSTK